MPIERYGDMSSLRDLKARVSPFILRRLKTDKEFVEKLLEKALVAVVQGSAFGLDGYFRISYATSMDNLKKALERIKSFCENLS